MIEEESSHRVALAAQAEVDAFISEIESTGTAFEQMRERNQILLDQLTSRDETNASVTSERLRVNLMRCRHGWIWIDRVSQVLHMVPHLPTSCAFAFRQQRRHQLQHRSVTGRSRKRPPFGRWRWAEHVISHVTAGAAARGTAGEGARRGSAAFRHG